MTVIEKVKEAESRIRLTMAGELDILTCPFCGEQNAPDIPLLCCTPLSDMVNAICDHVELKEQLRHVERVVDRLNSNQYSVAGGPKIILN